jgi:hypothetical protein
MKSKLAQLAEKLRRQGFDESYVSRDSGAVRVRCSQCQALVINGMACHERGCPHEK